MDSELFASLFVSFGSFDPCMIDFSKSNARLVKQVNMGEMTKMLGEMKPSPKSWAIYEGDILDIISLAESIQHIMTIVQNKDFYMDFSVTYLYVNQCNLSFSPEVMARLVTLDLNLNVDCDVVRDGS